MTLIKEPFIRYHEEKKTDTFTVKVSPKERAWLDNLKAKIHQPKDSTALKQLAKIGAKVLLDEKITFISNLIIENKRKNKRTGIMEYEIEEEAKVSQNKQNGDTNGIDKFTCSKRGG